MRELVGSRISRIVTDDGVVLFKRVTTVRMPNGKLRYPVDYYDGSNKVVRISSDERVRVGIPSYKVMI